MNFMGMDTGVMVRPTARSARCLPVLCFLVAGGSAAAAAEVDILASAGVGYSDNIGRVDQNQNSTAIGVLGLRFGINEDRRRLGTQLRGDVEWLRYSDDAYSSEVAGEAFGRVRLGLVEERLNWVIEDSFGQARRDPFSAPSPDNREYVNYFATGPDWVLQLGSAANVRLSGRYAAADYETSPTDSRRYGGSLTLERQMSSASRIGLSASRQVIEPRNGATFDSYDRDSAYVSYTAEAARSALMIDAGVNRVRGGDIDSGGLLARIELSREIGAFSRLTLRLGNEFTDSGFAFGQSLAAPLPGVVGSGDAALLQEPSPYTSRHASLGWTSEGLRTSVGLSIGVADENYERSDVFDRQLYSAGLNVSRAVGVRTSFSAAIRYQRYDFEASDVADNAELGYSLAFSWRPGRRVGIELSGERREFTSDGGAVDSDETRYWLRLTYSHQASAR